jgi:TRAP-type C4-dicarboxylate transport system substrate-binding protein
MAAKGGEIWRDLPEERRKVYDDAYKEASRKYQAAMAEYNGQNGQSLFASKSKVVQEEAGDGESVAAAAADDDTINQSHDNDDTLNQSHGNVDTLNQSHDNDHEPVDTPMVED